jgi:2-C-methyl-D-erythritol 4-phosphate cytidylyltransferase
MFDAIILLSGSASRSGLAYNKVLHKINDKAVLRYSVDEFLKCADLNKIILVIKETEKNEIIKSLSGISLERIEYTFGGAMRQDSVANGVKLATSDVVLIHDGARPNITKEQINEVYLCAKLHNSATLACKTIDTIVEKRDGEYRTLDRSNLYNIQTPQGVKRNLYLEAHNQAKAEYYYATDDVGLLVKYLNIIPSIVLGSSNNIKLTTSEDIKYLEYILIEKLKENKDEL